MSRRAPARTTRRSTRSQIDEWWLLAQTEVMEMAKRGVPGVFTYGFYDGWVPNYLFWIAITHNSFGRFYEVQSYGPDVQPNLQLGATQTSREWFRPNPPLPSIKWGPRNNTNIQESALLLALNQGGEGPRAVSGELLDEEQALDREGQERSDLRVGHSRGAAAQGRRRRHGERPAPPGRGGPHGRRPRSRRAASMSRPGDYIIRARPAVPHARRHVFQRAELSAGQSAAVRRHRLDHAVYAQREGDGGRRQSGARSADDDADGGREGARAVSRAAAPRWSSSTRRTTT